ncbi:uncharacterized protein EAE98_002267 [Botrytis deweyae]|uniref:Uncharacterized protein n=2 Tax=Botrytis TaxID=33196 RepID=A0A4Z1K463_9HELO|nr:uncharacterized protein EAE98_002267 [Botrytis deweyae]KAF7928270.1 hypothetical protein EAE99_005028 [Botrytis elliptica]KAF7936048.1 hypothetical protein EAE98_002267 [Botrytis deweyae]TGO80334.1 hypothetical protein BELL_0009g00200 [Botrytis elliptica]
MAPPVYNDNTEDTYRNDLDDWTVICQSCLKPVSATRPPIYNEVNCSCSELGTRSAGIIPVTRYDTQLWEPNITVYEEPVYTYQRPIQGYVSSHNQTSTLHAELLAYEDNKKFGDFETNWNNDDLKNGTKNTQDQPYSVEGYSWALRSWLTENESSNTLASKSSSMKAKKGSKRGDSSLHNSGSSMELGQNGWGPDPLTETGAWTSEQYQDTIESTLAMSGMNNS